MPYWSFSLHSDVGWTCRDSSIPVRQFDRTWAEISPHRPVRKIAPAFRCASVFSLRRNQAPTRRKGGYGTASGCDKLPRHAQLC